MGAKPKAFGIVEIAAKMPAVSVLDEPDLIATQELVLDFPAPPPINRTMGTRLGNEHPKVRAWRKHADAHLLFTRQSKHLRLIEGSVAIEILWHAQDLADIDNRIKHTLDYLERLRVLSNDNKVRDLRVRYGLAPDGCRVRIRPS